MSSLLNDPRVTVFVGDGFKFLADNENTYDVIVIGAGAVGENAAAIPAQRGLRVAIVESHLVGGECSYWACIPSKTLLNP